MTCGMSKTDQPRPPNKPSSPLTSIAPYAATFVTSDHDPFSPRVLTQRANADGGFAAFARHELGAETRLVRHGQERERGGVGRRGRTRLDNGQPATAPSGS
jgi:hypothetical protein